MLSAVAPLWLPPRPPKTPTRVMRMRFHRLAGGRREEEVEEEGLFKGGGEK